ncbi:MAG: hypothetical protein ACI4HI_06225 [Lachnospiraceae bacterium]
MRFKECLYTLFSLATLEEGLNMMRKIVGCLGAKAQVVESGTRKGRKCRTEFYSLKERDRLFAITTNGAGVSMPIVMPLSFAIKYYSKNGEFDRIIRLKCSGTRGKLWSPVLDTETKKNVYAHRQLLKDAGVDIQGKVVDHIFGNHGMCVRNCLRPCTVLQNSANKSGVKHSNCTDSEYYYDIAKDQRHSVWWIFYCLGIISEEQMIDFRKKELKIGY